MPPSVTIPAIVARNPMTPLLCMEANSSFLWEAELRPGNAGTWDGSMEVLDTSFANVPPDIRELRVRADAGFNPVFVWKRDPHNMRWSLV